MAITSSSTYSDILGEYLDNASYEENNSVSEARAFISACRALVVFAMRSRHGGGGGEEVEFDLAVLQKEKEAAQAWLGVNDTDRGQGQVSYIDFRGSR
jgi:hypothetical protein